MRVVLYIHGFLSSPKSFKSVATENWLAKNRPDIQFVSPSLSSYPAIARDSLLDLISKYSHHEISVIGSSMGGFWATFLKERDLVNQCVLVNPAVAPHLRFNEFVGKPLKNYHSDDIYFLGDSDLNVLVDCDVPRPNNQNAYWLMVQTGDEVLDYKLAVEKYHGAKQSIEPNGNHSFEGYENWINDIIQFLEF